MPSEEEALRRIEIPFRLKVTSVYENAVKILNNFFVGKRNERIELEIFRSLKQKEEESFNKFERRQQNAISKRAHQKIYHQITIGAKDERVQDKGIVVYQQRF